MADNFSITPKEDSLSPSSLSRSPFFSFQLHSHFFPRRIESSCTDLAGRAASFQLESAASAVHPRCGATTHYQRSDLCFSFSTCSVLTCWSHRWKQQTNIKNFVSAEARWWSRPSTLWRTNKNWQDLFFYFQIKKPKDKELESKTMWVSSQSIHQYSLQRSDLHCLPDPRTSTAREKNRTDRKPCSNFQLESRSNNLLKENNFYSLVESTQFPVTNS